VKRSRWLSDRVVEKLCRSTPTDISRSGRRRLHTLAVSPAGVGCSVRVYLPVECRRHFASYDASRTAGGVGRLGQRCDHSDASQSSEGQGCAGICIRDCLHELASTSYFVQRCAVVVALKRCADRLFKRHWAMSQAMIPHSPLKVPAAPRVGRARWFQSGMC